MPSVSKGHKGTLVSRGPVLDARNGGNPGGMKRDPLKHAKCTRAHRLGSGGSAHPSVTSDI